MKCALVLALVLFGLVALGSANPGFKVTLTQNGTATRHPLHHRRLLVIILFWWLKRKTVGACTGLNYARGVAIQYLEQRFSTVHVPDQGGDAHAPVIGKINWQLQNIVISGLSLPQSSISILPGRGVSVNMYRAFLKLLLFLFLFNLKKCFSIFIVKLLLANNYDWS
jgi:hypothetical protein